jgi:peroxiredoxin
MMKLNTSMSGKPFQMVAVSIDEGGSPDVESFFKSSGLSLPAYTDPDNQAAKTYGITGVPETFIIDKQGVIVKKVVSAMAWDGPEATAFLEKLMQ